MSTDALSCLPVCSITSPMEIYLTAIARDRPALDFLDLDSEKYSRSFVYLPLPLAEDNILCNMSTGSLRASCS